MGDGWGQILGPIIGAGMGLALEDHNQYMQQRQQQELGQIQVNQTEQLQKNSMDLQYDMWNKTNYPAQVQQLQKAGLNPALLYAKGGMGGVTGSPTGSVSGATAQQNPGEVQQMAGLGLQTAAQLRLLNAQKENIEADTKLKEANANKTAGVDTQQGLATIQQLMAQVGDIKARQQLTQVQTELAKFDLNYKDQTLDDMIKQFHAITNSAIDNARKMESEANVSRATVDDAVQTIKANAIGATIRNTLLKSEIQLTNDQDAKLKVDKWISDQTYSNMVQKNMQDWDRLGQDQQKLSLQNILQNLNINVNDDVMNKLLHSINLVLGKIE